MNPRPTQYAIVGRETADNFRLFDTISRAQGAENTKRFLEIPHLFPFLQRFAHSHPTIICFDLFSYDPVEATNVIGDIRNRFPPAVLTLYLDNDEYKNRRSQLPEAWQDRFEHYFRIYKKPGDADFDLLVNTSLSPAQYEALYNMGGNPVRITPSFQKGIVEGSGGTPSADRTIFISYSRNDWHEFVERLVANLTASAHRVWIDKDFIIGGDDWMDAVGAALRECDTLILVLSPDALGSKYVKMEYRFFFQHEKPIVPILYKKVDIPFELASIHYLDFTAESNSWDYETLVKVLSRKRGG